VKTTGKLLKCNNKQILEYIYKHLIFLSTFTHTGVEGDTPYQQRYFLTNVYVELIRPITHIILVVWCVMLIALLRSSCCVRTWHVMWTCTVDDGAIFCMITKVLKGHHQHGRSV